MPFTNSLFSFLDLCLAVMPVAVACVIDAMVCNYVGLFCSWGMEVLNWRQSFYIFMGMCAKISMLKRSVHGKFIPHFESGTKFFT
jgi:hypothetical protein